MLMPEIARSDGDAAGNRHHNPEYLHESSLDLDGTHFRPACEIGWIASSVKENDFFLMPPASQLKSWLR